MAMAAHTVLLPAVRDWHSGFFDFCTDCCSEKDCPPCCLISLVGQLPCLLSEVFAPPLGLHRTHSGCANVAKVCCIYPNVHPVATSICLLSNCLCDCPFGRRFVPCVWHGEVLKAAQRKWRLKPLVREGSNNEDILMCCCAPCVFLMIFKELRNEGVFDSLAQASQQARQTGPAVAVMPQVATPVATAAAPPQAQTIIRAANAAAEEDAVLYDAVTTQDATEPNFEPVSNEMSSKTGAVPHQVVEPSAPPASFEKGGKIN